jgi:dolichyl-phosphate-mannose-protein mannosyltransferase
MTSVRKNYFIFFLTFLVLFSRLFRLNSPSAPVLDESIFSRGFGLDKSGHPPLGYTIFKMSTRLLGGSPLGWRLPSVLSGTLLIPLVYFFTLRLFKGEFIALVSSFLLAFENLTFIHSRLGTIDISATFFILASFYFFGEFIAKSRPVKSRFHRDCYVLLSAFFLGLALSIKWSALFSWVTILFLAGFFCPRAVMVFFSLPILVYLATFTFWGGNLSEFGKWHRRILLFHTSTQEGFNLKLASPFWSWPTLFSPITYFRAEKFSPAGQFTCVVNASGNMPLLWAFLPALVFVSWEAYRNWQRGELNFSSLILPLVFFLQWFPWAFSPRPTFLYYFLPAIPFGCIAVSYCLEKAWKNSRLRSFVIGYLLLVVGNFVLLYPTFSAFPIPKRVFDLVNLILSSLKS